jgi:hypothetical protein
MAEILGLTVSDFPFLRMKPANMPWVLWGNLAWGWRDKPHLRDPANWPAPMRAEWGSDQDQGRTAGAAHQLRQHDQFRTVCRALDDFRPDLVLMLYRDVHETFAGAERPQWWLHTHEAIQVQPGNLWTFFRDNWFEEDPDKVVTLRGHPQAADVLAKHLTNVGIVPRLVPESPHPAGLGHNCIAGTVHLDFDRREFAAPVVPLGIDPFRFGRVRDEEGLSPLDLSRDDPPLTPNQAFDLGVEIARSFKPSPWRVAIVAAGDWSHANDSGKTNERIHPDVEADHALFAQWRAGEYGAWSQQLSFEQFEAHAQWELLIPTILSGAMSEVGAGAPQHADFQPTWVCNDNFVTTVFQPR